MTNYNENLRNLQTYIKKIGVTALLVSTENYFGNFTTGTSGIEQISGFSGSNGRAIVKHDTAFLSVDGRYISQANEQVDTEQWVIGMYPDFGLAQILSASLQDGDTLAIWPFSIKYKTYLDIVNLSQKLGFNIKIIEDFPLKAPVKSASKVYSLDYSDVGNELVSSRIRRIQNDLRPGEAILLVDNSIIGWTFGVRIKPTEEKKIIPSCVAFLTEGRKPALFCDIRMKRSSEDFDFFELEKFEDFISEISKLQKMRILLDYSATPLYFPLVLQKIGFSIVEERTHRANIVSVKNEREINCQREAAMKTSEAFIRTLAYANSIEKTTELDVISFFTSCLSRNSDFVDLSFKAISAFGDNSQMVHYSPSEHSFSKIQSDGLFLFDAGAHFLGATTDMTRTIYRGDNPDKKFQGIYSAVLKSVIMFSTVKFPHGTKAYQLDAIARQTLWNAGLDYNFGTGHGVGSFGNVHEPPRISKTSGDVITENMIITVEPGAYDTGYGIRLENMLLTKRSDINPGFLEFETLTYIPFCTKLIDAKIFSEDELRWINSYHNLIYDKFSNTLRDDEIALLWFKENTKEISL